MTETRNIPSDLVPLPTMPYSARPDDMPLDIEETRTALWYAKGNISHAAAILKTDPGRIRRFVSKSVYLTRELSESKEQLIDIAESVVDDALGDTDDKSRRDQMARFVLGSNMAKKRGWGSGGSVSVKNSGSGTVVVGWADGTKFEPNVIDVTPNKEESA